jgi:hypothetical protein
MISQSPSVSEEKTGDTCIIIRRRYSHLKEELQRTLKGDKDVKVLVDKRSGERRRSKQSIPLERRRADRRKPKEELVEVVISA